MGQLSERLRELAVLYGDDPRAWQAELDRVAHLEREDPKAAHEEFDRLKSTLAHNRLHALHGALVAVPWLVDVPDADTRGLNLKQVDREIDRYALALDRARAVAAALAETRVHLAGLAARRADVDLAPFVRVAFDDLASVEGAAEAARRAAAAEARAEERWRKARARAERCEAAKVDVPDLSSDAVPDAAEANARLDAVEAALAEAEKVEDLLARVRREVRDAAVKEFRPHVRRLLLEEAEREARREDRAAAASALEDCLRRAERLRRHAAEKAQEAARARRRGAAGPERERRRGDMQDPYG